MKLTEDTINRIIELSYRLDAENAERFPPHEPFPLGSVEIEDLQASPTKMELIELIRSLSNDEKAELEALFWTGRGDFDDFETAKTHSLEQDPKDAHMYLTGKVGLGEVIRAGALKLNP